MVAAVPGTGFVSVVTSSNGGLSVEQISEMCVDKLISVADTAPPEIAIQARAFRERMLAVVAHHVRMAVTEDRATMARVKQMGGK